MLDNELISLIISTIISQEEIAQIPGTPIKQAFQPTNQGVNKNPAAYLHKVHDRRLGSPARTDVWVLDPPPNPDGDGKMIHTEAQVMETTFQISALSTQNPNDVHQKTASDILNLIAYILGSTKTVETLNAKCVGILKISQVYNPYFQDDRHRFEASPYMEFVLTHKQIVASISPVIQSTELQILTV